jgi:hypothetical protein
MIARSRRRAGVSALALLLAVLAAGCAGSSTTSESTPEPVATETTGAPTVEQARKAGTVARAIENEPGRAAEILAENGMTAEGLESLILEIAKDPVLTDTYEEAKGTASSG